MADTKVSDLTELAAGGAAGDDLLLVVDTSAGASGSKKYQVAGLLSEAARLATSANLPLGAAAVGTSGTNTISVTSGTAPTSAPADCVQYYSSDFEAGAGDARAHIRGEAGAPVAVGNNAVAVPKPAATTGASQAGRAITVKASDAVASTDTAGAAAGGSVNITAGSAARNASGNANGGDVIITPGSPIGSGASGALVVRQPGGTPGTDEVAITHNGTNGVLEVESGKLQVKLNDSDFTVQIARDMEMYFDLGFSGNPQIRLSGVDGVVDLKATGQLRWSGAGDVSGDRNTGIVRDGVDGVLRATNGGSGNGWFRNAAGESALEADYTDSDATMGNTALSITVNAGRSYRIEGILQVSNTVASEGVKFDFNGGSATAATFFMASHAVGSVVAATQTSTTLDGDHDYTTVTGTAYIFFRGYLEVTNAGTFILRASESTTSSGTVTVGAGSWMALSDTRDL